MADEDTGTELGGGATDALGAALREDLENESVDGQDEDSTETPEGESGENGDLSDNRNESPRLTAEEANAVQLVANYNANPQGYLSALAQQQGLSLVPLGPEDADEADASASVSASEVEFPEDIEWLKEPILKVVDSLVSQKMNGLATRRELQGMEASIAPIQQSNVERELDGIHKGWRNHETEILSTLQTHPTLADDLPALVKLVVPTVDSKAATLARKGAHAKRTAARKGMAASVDTKPKLKDVPFREAVSNAFDDAARTLRERGEL